MARHPTRHTEPDDEDLPAVKPEADEPAYMNPVPEQEAAPTPQTITAAETTYYQAVNAAEMARQAAMGAAFLAYGFNPANFAAYKSAIAAANAAYDSAVSTATAAATTFSPISLGTFQINYPYWAASGALI